MDDHCAVRGEERRDLLLGAPCDCPKTGDVECGQEPVRIRRQLGVLREGEVVAVKRGAVGQVTRTQQRRRCRVRNDLVALGELVDHRLGRDPGERGLADVRCIRQGVAGLRHPLGMVEHLLNLHGPRYRVDHRRLNHALGSVRETDNERDAVAERHVLVEALPENGHSIEAGNPRAVEERRRTRGQRRADGSAEDRRQAIVAAQSPRDIEHAYVNARLDGQELGPVDPAERLPEIIDA